MENAVWLVVSAEHKKETIIDKQTRNDVFIWNI